MLECCNFSADCKEALIVSHYDVHALQDSVTVGRVQEKVDVVIPVATGMEMVKWGFGYLCV
jgi:hypothetical protein